MNQNIANDNNEDLSIPDAAKETISIITIMAQDTAVFDEDEVDIIDESPDDPQLQK